jgi:hypothetical protein
MEVRFLDWKQRQDELVNMYAIRMALEYNIIEVSTAKQKANGTRIFELPNGDKIGSFESGYVRRCNDRSRHYQLNKVYRQNYRYTVISEGKLKTMKSVCYARQLITDPLARMLYIVDFCKRNYNLRSLTHYSL